MSTYKIRDTYNLLYAKNFDPNEQEYIVHVQDVDLVELPALLMELSRLYFDQLGNEKEDDIEQETEPETTEFEVHQCSECMSIYDPELGDPMLGIAPNTAFEDLGDDYVCPLCEAEKSKFVRKIITKV